MSALEALAAENEHHSGSLIRRVRRQAVCPPYCLSTALYWDAYLGVQRLMGRAYTPIRWR
jgi:hypothetical protein